MHTLPPKIVRSPHLRDLLQLASLRLAPADTSSHLAHPSPYQPSFCLQRTPVYHQMPNPFTHAQVPSIVGCTPSSNLPKSPCTPRTPLDNPCQQQAMAAPYASTMPTSPNPYDVPYTPAVIALLVQAPAIAAFPQPTLSPTYITLYPNANLSLT